MLAGRQVAWSGSASAEAGTCRSAMSLAATSSERVELMATIEIDGRARVGVLSGESILLDGAGKPCLFLTC